MLTTLLPWGALVANPILEGLELQPFPPDSQWRLYSDLAWLWPIISPPADHIRKNKQFSEMIQAQCPGGVRTLLHLGCGGGHDDFTLKRHFEVTGVDVSAAMLELARRLNPEVDYHLGDMRTVRLEKTFDSVIIGDSSNYMLTREDLLAAFRTAFVHLRPGGILLTMAEETSDSFQQDKTLCSTHVQGDVEVTFVQNYYDPDPRDTTYEVTLLFLVRRHGQLAIGVDRHKLGLFGLDTWREILGEAGFTVKQAELRVWDVEERIYPVLVGTKARVSD